MNELRLKNHGRSIVARRFSPQTITCHVLRQLTPKQLNKDLADCYASSLIAPFPDCPFVLIFPYRFNGEGLLQVTAPFRRRVYLRNVRASRAVAMLPAVIKRRLEGGVH
jgi:hypothetical protein